MVGRKTALLAFVLGTTVCYSQDEAWKFTVGLKGTYTSSAKLYLNPEGTTPESRTEHLKFSPLFGGGLELRVERTDEKFFFVVSTEYLAAHTKEEDLVAMSSSTNTTVIDDGLFIIPIEVTANVYIPLGSDRFRAAMGAGLGAYYGERMLEVGGVKSTSVRSTIGYGMNIRAVLEYQIRTGMHVSFDLKFRDPEISVTNEFAPGSISSRGPREITTLINLDGMTIGLGILYEF
jgi:outer membrane protein W